MLLYDARLEPSHSSVKRGILAATNLGSACAVVANITAQIESEFLPPWLSCPQKADETRWQQWTSSLKSAWLVTLFRFAQSVSCQRQKRTEVLLMNRIFQSPRAPGD